MKKYIFISLISLNAFADNVGIDDYVGMFLRLEKKQINCPKIVEIFPAKNKKSIIVTSKTRNSILSHLDFSKEERSVERDGKILSWQFNNYLWSGRFSKTYSEKIKKRRWPFRRFYTIKKETHELKFINKRQFRFNAKHMSRSASGKKTTLKGNCFYQRI